MEFRFVSGNAGTWKCRQGAFEHGCEYAPVAGKTGYNPKFPVPLAAFIDIPSQRTVQFFYADNEKNHPLMER